jgi:transposase
MFIDCYPNNGKPYLRVVESYSVVIDGKRKTRKRTILGIGPLARYDDGKPDYLKRLRESFREGKPLIGSLSCLIADADKSEYITMRFNKSRDADAFSNPKNIGYFVLDGLYDMLGIYDVLNKYKSASRIEYDLNGHAKLLIFGRALCPDSKSATWRNRDRYMFDVVSSEIMVEVFRVLDVLDELSESIQQRMNFKIEKHIGRDKTICYYDVTNYWFEIDEQDEAVFSKTGEFISEGIRKRGPSKAKNRKPIVQMGLFTDIAGIPIAYKLFPGNNIDQTTLRPAMKTAFGKMRFGKVIIVADGGLNSGKNLAYILSSGNGYIASRSPNGSDKDTKKWIIDEDGYELNEKNTFMLKSKIRERNVKDEDGNTVTIKEKIVSYWSRKHFLRALHENQNFTDYLRAIIDNPDKLKDKQSKMQKYLKKTEIDKSSGEVIKTVSKLSLDWDKIAEDYGLMGYYTVMTSELDMPDREVINRYHGLSRIEDAFRIIKSDLEGRPVFVRTERHINAHFLICFIALTMIRLVQDRIMSSSGKVKDSTKDWEAGMSANKVKKALEGFMADALPDGYYRFTKITDDIKTIFDAFGIDPALPLPTESEIRQMKYQIDKSAFM